GLLWSVVPPVKSSFYHWKVEVDREATRTAYEQLDAPDPACCNACATFREAVRSGRVPTEITEFLVRAGADPAKAQEVWGAPDAGFLSGWWIVVGRMLEGEWNGSGERAYVELLLGFKCWITDEPTMALPPILEGKLLLQLEFEWDDHRQLAELESESWKESRPPGGAA